MSFFLDAVIPKSRKASARSLQRASRDEESAPRDQRARQCQHHLFREVWCKRCRRILECKRCRSLRPTRGLMKAAARLTAVRDDSFEGFRLFRTRIEHHKKKADLTGTLKSKEGNVAGSPLGVSALKNATSFSS